MRYVLTIAFIFGILFNGNTQEWVTDIKIAKQKAQSRNKNIVVVFQGSDWCAPCIKLDKEIWSTTEFQNLADDHFIMFKVDFPRRKSNKLPEELEQQNRELAEQYNKQGFFPFVVVIDADGNVLGELGYKKMSPDQYFNKLKAFEN